MKLSEGKKIKIVVNVEVLSQDEDVEMPSAETGPSSGGIRTRVNRRSRAA